MENLKKFTLTTSGFEDIDPVTGKGLGTYKRGLVSLDRAYKELENIIKSASNTFQYFNDSMKTIDPKSGLSTISFYAHPSEESNILSNIKNYNAMISQRKVNAGSFGLTVEDAKVYKATIDMLGVRAQKKAMEELHAIGGKASVNLLDKDQLDIEVPVPKGKHAKTINSYLSKHLAKSIEYSNVERDNRKGEEAQRAQEQREKEEKEDKRKQEKEAMASKRTTHRLILGAISMLTLISNQLRRVIASAVDQVQADAETQTKARDLNIPATRARQFTIAERVHGLNEGTILSSAQAFQNAFGLPTKPDEKWIEAIAMVVGEGVVEGVKSGFPEGVTPDSFMQTVIDAVLKRYENKQGYLPNVYYPSKDEARRSLVSWAYDLDSSFGDLISQVLDDASNNIFNFSNFDTWLTSARAGQTATSRFTEIDENAIKSLNTSINAAKNNLTDLANTIKTDVLFSLDGLINKVANINWGKSATETLKQEENRREYTLLQLPAMKQNVKDQKQIIKGLFPALEHIGDAKFDAILKGFSQGTGYDSSNGAMISKLRLSAYTDPKLLSAIFTYLTLLDRTDYYERALESGKTMRNFNPSDFDPNMLIKEMQSNMNKFYKRDFSYRSQGTAVGFDSPLTILTGKSQGVAWDNLKEADKKILRQAEKELEEFYGVSSFYPLLEKDAVIAKAFASLYYKNPNPTNQQIADIQNLNAYAWSNFARSPTFQDYAARTMFVAAKSSRDSNVYKAIEKELENLTKKTLDIARINLALTFAEQTTAESVYKKYKGEARAVQYKVEKTRDNKMRIILEGKVKGQLKQLYSTTIAGDDYTGEEFTVKDLQDFFTAN